MDTKVGLVEFIRCTNAEPLFINPDHVNLVKRRYHDDAGASKIFIGTEEWDVVGSIYDVVEKLQGKVE